jgi:hypothetical protein
VRHRRGGTRGGCGGGRTWRRNARPVEAHVEDAEEDGRGGGMHAGKCGEMTGLEFKGSGELKKKNILATGVDDLSLHMNCQLLSLLWLCPSLLWLYPSLQIVKNRV